MDTEDRKISEAYKKITSNCGKEFIKPTFEWLSNACVKFNKSIFRGKLPMVEFEIPTKSKLVIGETPVMQIPDTSKTYADTIRINDAFYVNDKILEDALIHEMIHVKHIFFDTEQFINDFVNGPFDGHYKPLFQKEMKEINSRFGRNVLPTAFNSFKNELESEPPNTEIYENNVEETELVRMAKAAVHEVNLVNGVWVIEY